MSKKVIAQILKISFHPIIVPLIALLLLFNSDNYLSLTPSSIQIRLYIVVLIINILLPIASYFFIYQFLTLNKEVFKKSKKRIIYGIFISSNIFAYALFNKIGASFSNLIPLTFLSASILGIIVFLISYKIDIDLQLTSLGAITGFITLISIIFHTDLINYLLTFLFLSGIIGSLLLYSKKINEIQIFAGFATGFFTTILTLFLLRLLL